MQSDKVYLGDSVYAAWDGEFIVLTTENGYGPSNTIMIDGDVWASLVDYIDDLKARAAATASEKERTNAEKL